MNASGAIAKARSQQSAAQQLFSPPPQKKMLPPPPIIRTRVVSKELLDLETLEPDTVPVDYEGDIESGIVSPSIQEIQTKPSEPSPTAMFKMYLSGQVMAQSTSMSTLSSQLQKLTQEIAERQNMSNEVRSKMLSLQGSIAMLHQMTAKFEEFKLGGNDNVTET